MDDSVAGRGRRPVRIVAISVGLLLVGMAGGWALRTVLAPAPDVLEGMGYTLVTAEQATVGQSLRLNVTAQWSPKLVVTNQAAGTVTSVELDGGTAATPGDRLYAVDLRPVVVAEGEVPAFREFRSGAEGDDVAQLQEFLNTAGYQVGDVDGRFGAALHAAVLEWQRDLGVDVDGVVRRGDLLFVPELPARLALDPELVVGASLGGGEPVVQVLPAEPAFSITLPENQARLVSPGMLVEIPRDNGAVWEAKITRMHSDQETSSRVAELAGVGQSVCRDECDQIPVHQEALLESLIHIVPERSGVTVPAAAVVTIADGTTAVVLASGDLRPVTVVAAASGMAVVDGVSAGEQVRVPGEVPTSDDPDDR